MKLGENNEKLGENNTVMNLEMIEIIIQLTFFSIVKQDLKW